MSINFLLSAEQEALKSSVREFANEHLIPLASEVKRSHDPFHRALLAKPAYEKAVELGLLAALIPEAVGGTASSGIDLAILFEELATVSPDFASTIGGASLALSPVFQAGTPEQVERLVAPFLVKSGAPVGAFAFSEPTGSANFNAPPPAEGLKTTARLDGDHWVIKGHKQWASHLGGWDGNGPDIMTIVCRTPGGISVLAATRADLVNGFSVVEHNDLVGMKGALTSLVRFDDVRVPKENLIGAEGQGAELSLSAFVASGATVGIFSTASMRAAFDVALTFARNETRGGASPIIDHQAVADVLTNAKGRIEASRLISWRALDAAVIGLPTAVELGLHAKIFSSETAVDVINDLIKVIGVRSYDAAFPIVDYLLDALAYPIFDGGNIGVRRRQMQEVMQDVTWNPLSASGME